MNTPLQEKGNCTPPRVGGSGACFPPQIDLCKAGTILGGGAHAPQSDPPRHPSRSLCSPLGRMPAPGGCSRYPRPLPAALGAVSKSLGEPRVFPAAPRGGADRPKALGGGGHEARAGRVQTRGGGQEFLPNSRPPTARCVGFEAPGFIFKCCFSAPGSREASQARSVGVRASGAGAVLQPGVSPPGWRRSHCPTAASWTLPWCLLGLRRALQVLAGAWRRVWMAGGCWGSHLALGTDPCLLEVLEPHLGVSGHSGAG